MPAIIFFLGLGGGLWLFGMGWVKFWLAINLVVLLLIAAVNAVRRRLRPEPPRWPRPKPRPDFYGHVD
jgi:hypothetical protein